MIDARGDGALAPPEADAQHQAKRLATLRAQAALAGYTLEPDTQGAGYYVTRWCQMRTFDTLDEAQAWLDRVCTGRASPPASVWGAYADGKAAFLAANPGATADDIEDHAKRLARRGGL